MRFYVLSTLFVLFYSTIHGQSKLYYFLTADSTKVGVKDEYGKIIIPAEFPNYGAFEKKELITSPTIEFYIDKDRKNTDYDRYNPAMPVGAVYSRDGKFLYHPQFFDNGPDYWSEGIRRYAENGKMGLVNFSGTKLTRAEYGFIEIFNYGYAQAYKGKMVKKFEDGCEHWTVISIDSNVTSCLINANGEVVQPLKEKESSKDYYFEGNYYLNPFVYSAEESAILAILNPWEMALSLLFELPVYQTKPKILQFEITERPNVSCPYYIISAFDDQKREEDYEILIHKDSKKIFVCSWNSRNEITPIRATLLKEIEQGLNREPSYSTSEMIDIAQQELKRLKSQP